jgi:hypothetical protein
MVLTKEELIAALQNEVRILLHLASKVDKSMVDYRPSPKQRSILELLQYMTIMGPNLVTFTKSEGFDMAVWSAADAAAKAMSFDQAVAAIKKQSDEYARVLSEWTDADFRGEVDFFGAKASRGSHLVFIVLGGYAAYRTQLFLYLKACGRDELNTMNLWGGADAAAA